MEAAGPGGLEPGHGAFTDQLPLELGQRREDAEHEAAGRGGGVDLRALAGEHPQAHAAGGQVLHGVDQMGEVAAEAVELPDDEDIALPQGPQAALESRPVVSYAGGEVMVEVDGVDAAFGPQGVALQVQRLGRQFEPGSNSAEDGGEVPDAPTAPGRPFPRPDSARRRGGPGKHAAATAVDALTSARLVRYPEVPLERAGDPTSPSGTDVDAYRAELRRLLLKAIDDLPPTFQEIVKLRDMEHRSNVEAARRLHISLQNAATRLHRAHQLLRARLTPHH